MADFVYQVPNYITFLRLALIPIFVFLLIDPSRSMVNLATLIFIFAAFTDYIDGFIARRWGAISDFGKLLDPIADKILVMAALVMLTSLRSDLSGDPWVPGWVVVLVISREIWITGIRAVAAAQGTIVPAGNAGKWKSFLQMVAIVLLLGHDYTVTVWNHEVTCQALGVNLLVLSLAFSYLSAFYYSYDVLSTSGTNNFVSANPESSARQDSLSLESKLVGESSKLN